MYMYIYTGIYTVYIQVCLLKQDKSWQPPIPRFGPHRSHLFRYRCSWVLENHVHLGVTSNERNAAEKETSREHVSKFVAEDGEVSCRPFVDFARRL